MIVPRAVAAAVALWTAALVWWARRYLLDDAFIHLRYAENLVARHFLTYDGVTPSQGTSSILYVGALAIVSAIGRWAYWPKALAVAGYVALGVATWRGRRFLGPWVFAAGFVFAAPNTVLVLTDGMETSWAATLAVVLAFASTRERSEALGARALAGTMLAASLVIWLRVDMLAIVAAMAVADLVRRRPASAIALGVGTGVALVALVASGGHVLSDGAVAKHTTWHQGAFLLRSLVLAHAAAGSLGLGLIALWAVSWVRVHRVSDVAGRRAAAVVNLTGPVFWITVVLAGQLTHGVRYFVPFYVFATAWNFRAAAPATFPRWPTRWAVVAVPLALLCWTVETIVLDRIVRTHGETLEALRSAGLERFAGMPALAFDVGQVGYLSGADVCDPRGLINGRAAARASGVVRRAECWAREPVFVFLSEGQEQTVPEVSAWPVCRELRLDVVRKAIPYRLRVRPGVGCPSGGR